MRRKNRKWVAMAVGMYGLILIFAYRWGSNQRYPDGNLFVHLQHEGMKRQAAERAQAAKPQTPPLSSPAEVRLTAAGPAYVAARYDATHVVFMVATDTENRFPNSPLRRNAGMPTRVAAPDRPFAPLAGLQELYEPDSQSLHFFPKIVQRTQAGDRWSLSLSADATIPVAIDRVVIAPMGCSLALGFLATVPADQQNLFTTSQHDYFVIRRDPVEAADPPVASHVGEIVGWKVSATAEKEMESALNARMKQDLARIDARLLENAGSPGVSTPNLPIGDARARVTRWLQSDQKLARGEGTLDYDLRAFQLAPDGVPRLFVRARWRLGAATAFLMTAWLKADRPDAAPTLLFADSSWSARLREGEAAASLGGPLDFQTILNEFDADHDGWAELLILSRDGHAAGISPPSTSEGASLTIQPYLYTDQGLVAMKAPLRRDLQSPESCLDP